MDSLIPNIRFLVKVIFLLTLAGKLRSQHLCTPGLQSLGYTVPRGDITLEYGSPLDILCVLLDNSTYNSSSMAFLRNSQQVPSEMVEVVNATAIKLHVKMHPKTKDDKYTCVVNYKNNDFVCMNTVFVGVPPQEVEDFKCIGYNYEKLTCTWTPPENYLRTEYNLSYELKSRSSRGGLYCPERLKIVNNQMKCTWTLHTTPAYRQVHDEMNFTLSMHNALGTNIMKRAMKHWSYVLPDPPVNLIVTDRTTSSLMLNWKLPSPIQAFPPGVHFRIMYQGEFMEKKWHIAANITNKTGVKDLFFNLTDLPDAHALYDIRVSMRSAAASQNDESMWSNNATTTARTSAKIPSNPPVTVQGGYEVTNYGNKDIEEFVIYWQQIPEREKNGPNFDYLVVVDDHPEITATVGSIHATLNLTVSKNYKIRIWSRNSVGTSLSSSSISIPQRSERLSEPSSVTSVESENDNYTVVWGQPRNANSVTGYTVFWCINNRPTHRMCTSSPQWLQVDGTHTKQPINITTESFYQFAVASYSHNSSSGLSWALCNVLSNQKLRRMKEVFITRVGSTFIEVEWKLDCYNTISEIGFIAYYCPIISPARTSCKEPERNVTFGNSEARSGNITNLKPYTTYRVKMAVMSFVKRSYSQESDPSYNTTNEAAPSTPPLNFHCVNVSNTSAVLKWEPPPAINGVLKKYIIKYNKRQEDTDPNKTSYELKSLESFVAYFVTIEACTTSCSDVASVNFTTKIGYPSKIDQPMITSQNDSHIVVGWRKPEHPRGRNDFYEMSFKKLYEHKNESESIIRSEPNYTFTNCGNGGQYNAYYVAVRAVNNDSGTLLPGPWSPELPSYCKTNGNYMVYILSVIALLFFVAMGYLFNRLYKHFKIMRDVEVKLPPGLAPAIADHTLVPWNTEKHVEERDSQSPADEELLLVKMTEGRQLSGDSSGCSSGHESVTSSLESGTHISSTSDSGTEQIIDNYCVLGVDPKVTSPVKTINPGYVPFTEPVVKSSGYVVAGIKSGNDYKNKLD